MFSKIFINRPVFASVISIIIVIAGIMGLRLLPVEEYPKLSPPRVVVSAFYPGADAQTIANTVAAPLENAINGVDDMLYMQSTSSSSGSLSLSIYFKPSTNPQSASVNVNNRVNRIIKSLPLQVQRSGVNVTQSSSSILGVVSFFDPKNNINIIDLNNYVTINVLDAIKRISGVGSASVIGSKNYSMRIWINPDLLKHFSLTTSDVINAIKEQNSEYSAGKIGEAPMMVDNPYVYAINPTSRLKTAKEFGNIILRTGKNGDILRLKDVAKVEIGSQNYSFESRLNGIPMVPIIINLQNGANAIATMDLVKKKLSQLSHDFPSTMTYSIPYDTTQFVKVSIKEVVKTFIEAMILVFLVMYLFLGNFRATLIPAIAVPVSILGTFAVLYVIGFSINLITLFALILAIGIVVDDAIIVIENVERILEEYSKISVKDATILAMKEISSPIISIVLVLCAVFAPVAFLSGFVGIIQRQFALTLVSSVVISGFVALSLTPALCAVFLRRNHGQKLYIVRKFNDFFRYCTDIFSYGVAKILRHLILSLIVAGIIIYSMSVLFRVIPSSLVPNEDKGVLIAITQLPAASTVKRTLNDVDMLSSVALKNPNIKDFISLIGYDIFSGVLKENSAVSFIRLRDWSKRKGSEDSSFAIAKKLSGLYYVTDKNSLTFVTTPPPINGLSLTGGFEAFAQNLDGKNYDEISTDMQKLISAANKRPELTQVRTTLDTNFPQYKIILDIDKIKLLGLNVNQIFDTIEASIGKYYVNDFNMLGKVFSVNLRAKSDYRDEASDISNLFVKNAFGKMVSISSVAKLIPTTGADTVDRFNGFPAAKIMGQVGAGYTSSQAINAIREVMKEVLGDRYSIGWSGSSYQEVNSQNTGKQAFIFGIIFVFLILAAQYERWLMPLAIVTAVPFSIFGALVATKLSGFSNDIYFQIGLLLLIGLSAKNAILIVEFAMQEHRDGKGIFEASIRASKMRFRPIVMTSLAFTLGVLPMVLGSGAGIASRQSLGIGVIGGMIAATTISIFFVPMFFYLLESFNDWLDNKKNGDKNV